MLTVIITTPFKEEKRPSDKIRLRLAFGSKYYNYDILVDEKLGFSSYWIISTTIRYV